MHVDKCETVAGGGFFSSSYVTYTVTIVRPEEQGGVTEVARRYSEVFQKNDTSDFRFIEWVCLTHSK